MNNKFFYLTISFKFLPLFLIVSSFAAATFGNVSFDAGTIKGTVQALAGNGDATLIEGARLTLVSKAANKPLKTETNAAGEFIFESLAAGEYTLTIEADGLKTVTRDITLTTGATLNLIVDLSATINETVTIRAEEGILSTSETVTSNVVRAETLNNEPFRADNFQNAIALTPGVIRDGSGNDYLKGSRVGQSGYTVNGSDVTDPVTGRLAFETALESANSVEIEENPYSAEYGRFIGGVTNLETKGGDNEFRFRAARFFPTLRNVFSTTIDSFRPRVAVSGPIRKDKLFYLLSFEYRFTRAFVPSLPKQDNNTTLEGFYPFAQIDWNINKSNTLKFNFAAYPQKIRNVMLDTFNPAPVTPNYKQRGFLFSVAEQSVFSDTSFLSTEISYKTFDVDVFAKGIAPFSLVPQVNRGSYFADTRRQSGRLQFQESYYSRPFEFGGQHQIKAGFEFNRTNVEGSFQYSPISIRRTDDTLAQRIDFVNYQPVDYSYNEISAFVQDRWIANKKLTFEYGLRVDRDGIAKEINLSPRFSFLLSPFKDSKTLIRGGIGIFYDKTIAAAGYFSDANATRRLPERIVTNFAANGTTITSAPRRFFNLTSDLSNPRSVRYSLQVDRGFTKNLIGRVGFLQRNTRNDLLVLPFEIGAASGANVLISAGRAKYTELQFIANYNRPEKIELTGSYVWSRSQGDLNTADRFIGDYPAFVVRPNEYNRQPFDAPHRFLLSGNAYAPYGLQIAPVFEIRSGFPFSAVNERLEFVGARNRAGRFPMYMSLDVQITKGFKVPKFVPFAAGKRFRAGAALFNLTNHFNPRDVQNNITSPDYGKFYNSIGLGVKAKFDLEL